MRVNIITTKSKTKANLIELATQLFHH